MRTRLLRVGTLLCVGLFVVTGVGSLSRSQPAPAAQPIQVARASNKTSPATSTWQSGVTLVRKGRFQEALSAFQKCATGPEKDELAKKAAALIQAHLAVQARAETERRAEFQAAAARVRNAMTAEAALPALEKAKLAEKLRTAVQDALTAFNEAGNAETYEVNDPVGAVETRKTALEAYAKTLAGLGKAKDVLKGRTDAFARLFAATADRCAGMLRTQQALWQSARGATRAQRKASAKKLEAGEDEMLESLGDVEALTSTKPWRVGLMHIRLAKTIAVPADHLASQDWYVTFVSQCLARGRKAIEDAKWYDALAIFTSLQELDPYNADYKKKNKAVRRHVRVLGLYGQKSEAENINGDGDGKPAPPPEDGEPTWKEMVSGVDVDMVEKAIEQLDGYYVRSVDYRQVARGGLQSVKILAETPQASHTFPALANKAKQAEFVKAIDKQLEMIEKRDRVDHLDLQLALNSVLRASDRTVRIPTEVLAVEFTDGFLDELDKFSSMIWPNDVDIFRKQTMGNFSGVGIQITKEPGEPLKVVTPLAGSPAFKAGVKTNDLIVTVDGKRTEGRSIDKLVRLITGPKGTTVTLGVKRIGKSKPIDITIERAEINIRTVKGWRRDKGGEWDYVIDPSHGVGYMRVTQFTDKTALHVDLVLARLRKAGIHSLIVDLRFNPGGLLRGATKVADEFLSSGRIVSTRGLQVRQSEINANSVGRWLRGDVVFLVNQHSASASEIVSGAIKDRQRGLLVGERTYGKGSVQNVIPIRRHKAFLKLTTAYYYLPLGRCLHRIDGAKSWGVDPDVDIKLTPRQIKRWLDIRRKTDLIQDVDPAELTTSLKAQYEADYQLNAAVLLLRVLQLDQQRRTKAAA